MVFEIWSLFFAGDNKKKLQRWSYGFDLLAVLTWVRNYHKIHRLVTRQYAVICFVGVIQCGIHYTWSYVRLRAVDFCECLGNLVFMYSAYYTSENWAKIKVTRFSQSLDLKLLCPLATMNCSIFHPWIASLCLLKCCGIRPQWTVVSSIHE